jgi:hypothetical protein
MVEDLALDLLDELETALTASETTRPTAAEITSKATWALLNRIEADPTIRRLTEETMNTQDTRLVEEMFVQVARGASASDGTLTLNGISPSTLYFSDRPERVVGHMTTSAFVDDWAIGPNSFAEDPPNAVLSFTEPDADAPSDVVVVLHDPQMASTDLGYSVEVLDGELPMTAGPCTLFIDPLGRPLSPVSIAGVRRRDRRRERRRF